MTYRQHLIGIPLVLCLIATAHAKGGHEQHQHHAPARLTLDHGKKWPTDAPLRSSMDTLRAAFDDKQHAIHQGKLSPADYQTLAATVDKQVAHIVATCKLKPEADAMLHVVVSQLQAGAQQMKGKDQPAAGAQQVVAALNSYGRYFDHSGWKKLH